MTARTNLNVKRVYEAPEPGDGMRILVDRLWPRGMKKEKCALDAWMKNVAPSDALRQWYRHDPSRWAEFQDRYFDELDGMPDAWGPILQAARKRKVTLLFGASDTEHNNAVALREYLDRRLKRRKR